MNRITVKLDRLLKFKSRLQFKYRNYFNFSYNRNTCVVKFRHKVRTEVINKF
jgi:hypothetical protein